MNLQLNKNVTQTERQKLAQKKSTKNAELNKPVTDQRRFESRARLKQDSKHALVEINRNPMFSRFTTRVRVDDVSRRKSRFFQLIQSTDFFKDGFAFQILLEQAFDLQRVHDV